MDGYRMAIVAALRACVNGDRRPAAQGRLLRAGSADLAVAVRAYERWLGADPRRPLAIRLAYITTPAYKRN